MDIQQQLDADLKNALRAGDEVAKRTIRMVVASIKLLRVERGGSLDNSSVIGIIQKEIKSRKEAIQEAQKVNRIDLVNENEAEIRILENYLPKQLSQEEIREIIHATIAEVNPSGVSEMGRVMKALMPKIQGRAPGDAVSALVKEILQG